MTNTKIENTNNLETRSMIAASGQVLCTILPSDFEDKDDEEMDQFVVDNAWEPFEHWNANQLWSQIRDVANALISFHTDENKLTK
jgi:hypothetical protein